MIDCLVCLFVSRFVGLLVGWFVRWLIGLFESCFAALFVLIGCFGCFVRRLDGLLICSFFWFVVLFFD